MIPAIAVIISAYTIARLITLIVNERLSIGIVCAIAIVVILSQLIAILQGSVAFETQKSLLGY